MQWVPLWQDLWLLWGILLASCSFGSSAVTFSSFIWDHSCFLILFLCTREVSYITWSWKYRHCSEEVLYYLEAQSLLATRTRPFRGVSCVGCMRLLVVAEPFFFFFNLQPAGCRTYFAWCEHIAQGFVPVLLRGLPVVAAGLLVGGVGSQASLQLASPSQLWACQTGFVLCAASCWYCVHRCVELSPPLPRARVTWRNTSPTECDGATHANGLDGAGLQGNTARHAVLTMSQTECQHWLLQASGYLDLGGGGGGGKRTGAGQHSCSQRNLLKIPAPLTHVLRVVNIFLPKYHIFFKLLLLCHV